MQGDEEVNQEVAERDARVDKLSVELKNWQDRLPPLIERYQQRNAEAEELEQQLAAAHERIEALEQMVGSEQTRVEPVDPDALGDTMDASNDPIEEEQQDEIAHNDHDIEDQPGRDDLQLIKGVGPAIEKTLNEMGISRFDQIAQMSEYDIDRVAHRLKGFRSRIYREDWIGQARDLHDQKVNSR